MLLPMMELGTNKEKKMYINLMNTIDKIVAHLYKYNTYRLYLRLKDDEILFLGDNGDSDPRILEEGVTVRYIGNIDGTELNDQLAFERIIKSICFNY